MRQCETTSSKRDQGAALFGYTSLYGAVPGVRPSTCACRRPSLPPIPVPEGPSDQRFLYLSDILPTAWRRE